MPTTTLRFAPTDLVTVVIDVQERLAAAMEFKLREQVAANVRRLLALAREQASPALVTEQYPEGLGRTLPDVLADVPEGTPVIEKLTFSCLATPDFRSRLAATGRKTVVLCGMETHVCLYQTGLDLLDAGYRVFVPQDACCSRSATNWRTGLHLLEAAGAVVTSTETLMFQALREAGTPVFKSLQPWLR